MAEKCIAEKEDTIAMLKDTVWDEPEELPIMQEVMNSINFDERVECRALRKRIDEMKGQTKAIDHNLKQVANVPKEAIPKELLPQIDAMKTAKKVYNAYDERLNRAYKNLGCPAHRKGILKQKVQAIEEREVYLKDSGNSLTPGEFQTKVRYEKEIKRLDKMEMGMEDLSSEFTSM